MTEIFPSNKFDRSFVDFFAHISWSTSQAPYSQPEVAVHRCFQKMKPMLAHDCVTVDFKSIDTLKAVAK